MMCPECGIEHAQDELCPVHVVTCDSLGASGNPPPIPPAPSPVGQLLGSYRVERKVGEGATGTVFLARHETIGSLVAAKVLRPRLAENPAALERFTNEARALSMVGHENIVKVFDMGVASGLHYILMEYLEGELLSALPVPMAPSVAIPILVQTCEALDAAHRIGVVHMDVKQSNVFLIRRRRGFRVKVLDFGAARLLSEAMGGPAASAVVGTPDFMSPEQWNRQPIDGRTDIYSLGIAAYRLATGRMPFSGDLRALYVAHRDAMPEPPHKVNPNLPIPWSEAILRALAKRKEDRFASASDFAAALRKALRRRRAGSSRRSAPAAPEWIPAYVGSSATLAALPASAWSSESTTSMLLPGDGYQGRGSSSSPTVSAEVALHSPEPRPATGPEQARQARPRERARPVATPRRNRRSG